MIATHLFQNRLKNIPADPKREKIPFDPLKLTAILYLAEALSKEKYEDCKEIVDSAYEVGVTPKEMQMVVHSYILDFLSQKNFS